jgi:DNA-binding MarR family transcriptional regulator
MPEQPRVSFITSHAAVLLNVERRPDATVRALAETVGLTERQVHRVLGDLEAEGYITRERVGRQNRYTVNRRRRLHESSIPGQEIGDLLAVLGDGQS